jgi:hypothetical protein
MQQAPAGTKGASEIGRKIVSSLAATESRETNAADVCTIATGRLFITEQSSKLRFLINTGSDLCVFPRKLIPQRREHVIYDVPPKDGCRLASTWDCAEVSRGGSWWPTSHNLLLEQISCLITASWWAAQITA